MLKKLLLSTCIAMIATTAIAFDLSTVKTKIMRGLEGPTKGEKLKNKVIAKRSLAQEGIASLAGRDLRTRFWTVGGNGGIVPIHDHAERPAVFTVLSGDITEHSNKAEKPIDHMTHGLAVEEGEVAHWWINKGAEDVLLIAFDVVKTAKDLAAVPVAATPVSVKAEVTESKDAKLSLLGAIDLGAHFKGAYGSGYVLSTYQAVLQSGGVLPSFVAAGEPLQVFVSKGAVMEHRIGAQSQSQTELTLHTGSAVDAGESVHWKNEGSEPATLYFGVVESSSEVEGVPRTAKRAHTSH